MKSLFTTIALGVSLLFTSVLNGQEVNKDSLLQTLAEDQTDNERISRTINYITNYATSKAEIEEHYNSIIQLTDNSDNDTLTLRLQNITMSRLFDLGYYEIAQKYLVLLLENSEARNIPTFTVLGYLSQARVSHDAGRIEEANRYLMEGRDAIKDKDLPNEKASLMLEMALYARQSGDLLLALQHNTEAIAILEGQKSHLNLSNAYSSRGRIFRFLGEIDSAAYYYQKAERLLEGSNAVRHLSTIYNNLGNIDHIRGHYDSAIDYYMKSIAIKEDQNNQRGLSIGYHNIAAIKMDIQEWEDAIKYFKLSNELGRETDFVTIQIHNGIKLAAVNRNIGEYQQALDYDRDALALAKASKSKSAEAKALAGLGTDYLRLGQPQLAITNLKASLSIAEQSKNKSDETDALIAIADWYTQDQANTGLVSNALTDREAEKILEKAYDLSLEMDYSEKKLLVYEGLIKLYTKTKNYEELSEILTEQIVHKDSLFSNNKYQAISEWEAKLDVSEKEKQIIILEAKNKISRFKTRLWQYIFLVAIALLSMMAYYYFKYQRNKNEKNRLKENELLRTKVSSDLHDDVGTMMSSLAMQMEVLSLTAEGEQLAKLEKLSAMSRTATGKMRDTVWAIDSRKDRLESMIDRMQDYLAEISESGKLKVDFDQNISNLESQLAPDIRQNVYLIFKEAVNNAFKYSEGTVLRIVLHHTDKSLSLLIHDNGDVDPESVKTSGTGLTNMKMRAKRIGAHLDITYQDGFLIDLKLSK